jgi:hypothetical protein
VVALVIFGFRPASGDANQNVYYAFRAFKFHVSLGKKNIIIVFILCSWHKFYNQHRETWRHLNFVNWPASYDGTPRPRNVVISELTGRKTRGKWVRWGSGSKPRPRCCHSPGAVGDNMLNFWRPIFRYYFTNAKIISGVLRASLNNSFTYYCHWMKCNKHVLLTW